MTQSKAKRRVDRLLELATIPSIMVEELSFEDVSRLSDALWQNPQINSILSLAAPVSKGDWLSHIEYVENAIDPGALWVEQILNFTVACYAQPSPTNGMIQLDPSADPTQQGPATWIDQKNTTHYYLLVKKEANV